MYCKTALFLYILCIAKHFSMFVENNYLTWFDYTDFLISINPFTINPGTGKFPLSLFWPEVHRRY